MEEKNDLQDILLEKNKETKASKMKKLALVASILVLVFLLVIIIMKAINKPVSKENKIAVKPPVVIDKSEEVKKDPIIQHKKDNFDKVVEKLKEDHRRLVEAEKQNLNKEQVLIPSPQIKKITSKTEENKPKQVPINTIKKEPIKIIKPKSPTKKVVHVEKKPIPKPAKQKKKIVTRGVYIQVLASSNMNPDKTFIAKLKAHKYPYVLHKTKVKGKPYLKLLVGPYGSEKKAREALVGIKRNVAPQAFLFWK